jgi:quinol monooxygenase YgiN
MATMLAHITIRVGREAEFEAVLRRLYEATHRLEPDVIRYEYWRGAAPRTYYTLLSYPDFLSFIVHQTSEHHESASPELRPLFEAFKIEWVDPIRGASPLVETEPQDAPADADELTAAYAMRFRAEVAPWWAPLRSALLSS